jgi:hypothetical protein
MLQNDDFRDKQEYCVRSWLILVGGNASTIFGDTQDVRNSYDRTCFST